MTYFLNKMSPCCHSWTSPVAPTAGTHVPFSCRAANTFNVTVCRRPCSATDETRERERAQNSRKFSGHKLGHRRSVSPVRPEVATLSYDFTGLKCFSSHTSVQNTSLFEPINTDRSVRGAALKVEPKASPRLPPMKLELSRRPCENEGRTALRSLSATTKPRALPPLSSFVAKHFHCFQSRKLELKRIAASRRHAVFPKAATQRFGLSGTRDATLWPAA